MPRYAKSSIMICEVRIRKPFRRPLQQGNNCALPEAPYGSGTSPPVQPHVLECDKKAFALVDVGPGYVRFRASFVIEILFQR